MFYSWWIVVKYGRITMIYNLTDLSSRHSSASIIIEMSKHNQFKWNEDNNILFQANSCQKLLFNVCFFSFLNWKKMFPPKCHEPPLSLLWIKYCISAKFYEYLNKILGLYKGQTMWHSSLYGYCVCIFTQ